MYYIKDKAKLEMQWEKEITLTLLMMLSVLFCVFYFSNIEARDAPHRQTVRMDAHWKCQKCGYRNWAENGDWRGDYYCLRCGEKK